MLSNLAEGRSEPFLATLGPLIVPGAYSVSSINLEKGVDALP